ncbi:MAG: glycosyltransferase, partial [Actinomycetota bacterium]|nr:glycosyltransferase [Actinomycetota bacterium]
MRREAEALRDAGFEVHVVSLHGSGERALDLVDGVRVFRLPLGRKRAGQLRYLFDYAAFFSLALPTVAKLHLRHRYALVQVNTMPDFLVFAALGPKLVGTRVLLDVQELMPELYASKFGLSLNHPLVKVIAAQERISAGFADAVMTVHEPGRVLLLGRGVRVDAVVMNSPDERFFPRRASAPLPRDGELRLISHGTLVERYGFDTAIRAVAILRQRFPRVRLTILGDGEFAPALRNLVNELDLGAHVELLGFRPLETLADLLAQAHVGIAANKIDDFTRLILPTKLLEYVAVGVPAVVAR